MIEKRLNIKDKEKKYHSNLYVNSDEHPDKDIFKNKTDEYIWNKFKQGNKNALIHIYSEYFPVLFNYALQFNSDREFVKDVIQDLFIYIYNNRKSINSTTSIKFYLFKSLRRRLRVEIDKSKSFGRGNFESSAIQNSYESEIIIEEDQLHHQKLLKNAIETLSQKQKEVIYYFYYQNFSYQEIASIMGFSQVKSARKLLYRALENLKDKIKVSDLFLFVLVFANVNY